MGWSTPNDGRRTVPLVVRWDGPQGKQHCSFPGGVDKSVAWLFGYCLDRSIKMGYIPHDGQCWGFAYRDIAGTNIISFHGKGGGRAIDINAPQNQRGTRGDIPIKVVEVFERCGFTWGGRWGWTDPMHFEAGKSRLWYWRKTRQLKRELRRGNNR